jgi:hypothetical protein
MPAAARRSAQAITGPASKANCVAIAKRASVRSAKSCFQRSASITSRLAAVGVDVAVALGVAGHMQPVKPALSKNPVSSSCIDEWNAPRGVATPPASTSAWRHAGLALVARDPVGQRGGSGMSAPGNAASRLEPLVAQALRGGDHVLDRGAVDMGDVDAGALAAEASRKSSILGGGARHHLDRRLG